MRYATARTVLLAVLIGSIAFAQSGQGNHDTADCQSVSGWATAIMYPNVPPPPGTVDIYGGAQLLAAGIPANQYRPDVAAAGFANGSNYTGFSWPTPASLKDGQPHQISVKFGGSPYFIWNSPKTLTCSGQAPYSYYATDAFGTPQVNTAQWSANGIVSGGGSG